YAVWSRARKECPGGGEYDAGLCYPACRAGYHGLGPMCWQNCPSDMLDDGATCRAPISSIAKRSQTRGVGTPMGCGPDEEQNGALCYPKCPPGYNGVGPVCWKGLSSQGRGVGRPLHGCAQGQELDGALCYPACPAGFKAAGPVCWETCPPGYSDS